MRRITFWMDAYPGDDEPLLMHHKPQSPPSFGVKRFTVTIEVPDWLPEDWKDPYAGEAIEVQAEVSP
jgi:hypothetical protein